METELSYVQVQILSKLMLAQHLNYAQIRPDEIDNDLFKYHLKFLVEKGYIEKNEDGYQLTPIGQK